MVKITVHYGHPLTEITGKAKEEIVVKKGSTVLSLLKNLATKYGDRFKDYVFSNFERNQVNKTIIISLNAKSISDKTERIKIENNDFLAIFPPTGGG